MSINEFYIRNVFKKPLEPNSAVNVIYLTNKCNLACTYCYEDLADRPPQIVSEEDIRNYVDDAIEREKDGWQTQFVIFGGEPTLEWDKACYLMNYAYSKKKQVHFNMITNGIKFLSQKFRDTVKSNEFYQKGILSVDISFDGIGNQDRVFHNGKDSTKTMLRILRIMVENNMKYRLRYTIHNKNADYAYDDISKIIKTFKPERVITTVAWSTLTEAQTQGLSYMKERFREGWLNKDITTPICELFCDVCDGCGVRKEFKTYFSDEGKVSERKNEENAPKFNDFKDKGTT